MDADLDPARWHLRSVQPLLAGPRRRPPRIALRPGRPGLLSSPPQHPSIRHIEHTIHDANLVNAVAGVSAVGFYAAYLMRSESTQLAHAVLRDFCCRCLSQIGTPLEQVLGVFDLPFAGVGVFRFLVYLFWGQNEAPSL